jgi:endonuclease III
LNSYDGDAGRIWRGPLTAREVQARLDRFQGIGQKKAAMAVEILERDLGVPIKDMQGSDVAYDIHVRRVFLRSGLAQRDELEHILSIARALHPERPGEIDSPAWLIGRQWCHAGTPNCGACPINPVCPKIVSQIKISSQ